jgi:hypothetical protein
MRDKASIETVWWAGKTVEQTVEQAKCRNMVRG